MSDVVVVELVELEAVGKLVAEGVFCHPVAGGVEALHGGIEGRCLRGIRRQLDLYDPFHKARYMPYRKGRQAGGLTLLSSFRLKTVVSRRGLL